MNFYLGSFDFKLRNFSMAENGNFVFEMVTIHGSLRNQTGKFSIGLIKGSGNNKLTVKL